MFVLNLPSHIIKLIDVDGDAKLAYDISISHWILNIHDGSGGGSIIIILPYLWICLATH